MKGKSADESDDEAVPPMTSRFPVAAHLPSGGAVVVPAEAAVYALTPLTGGPG
jgi:hypothetical protein